MFGRKDAAVAVCAHATGIRALIVVAHSFVVMGGQADKVSSTIEAGWQASLGFADAVRLALKGLTPAQEGDQPAAPLPPGALEVAVLDRLSESSRGSRRAFRRLNDADITALLA